MEESPDPRFEKRCSLLRALQADGAAVLLANLPAIAERGLYIGLLDRLANGPKGLSAGEGRELFSVQNVVNHFGGMLVMISSFTGPRCMGSAEMRDTRRTTTWRRSR